MKMKRVMLVDSDGARRDEVAKIIMMEGYGVTPVPGAEGALILLEGDMRYDHIFAEVELSGVSGPELLAIIRANPPLASLPFALMGDSDFTTFRGEKVELGRFCLVRGASYHPHPINYREMLRDLVPKGA